MVVAKSLAMGICLGLFVLQKETEDCSVSESCPSSRTSRCLPHHREAAEQTEKSKMIIHCWKPACFRLAVSPAKLLCKPQLRSGLEPNRDAIDSLSRTCSLPTVFLQVPSHLQQPRPGEGTATSPADRLLLHLFGDFPLSLPSQFRRTGGSTLGVDFDLTPSD